MPNARPILLPENCALTAKPRSILKKFCRMTCDPDGIFGASPMPTNARKTASGRNWMVSPHNAVASDQNATAAGKIR